MNLIIRVAARLLPAGLRDRYREQWLADARDAPEAGLRPADIALAALSFALAVPRSHQRRPRGLPDVLARVRLASALALSAAVLGVSQFGNFGSNEGLTSNGLYDFVVSFGIAFMTLYLIIAPLVAVLLVFVTRGVTMRVRLAVLLLVASILAGVAQGLINSIRASAPLGTSLISEGALASILALAFLAIACALLIRERRVSTRLQSRDPVRALVSLGVALAALGLGVANALSLRELLHAADVDFVRNVLDDQVAGAEQMLADSAQATTLAIVAWAITALLGCFVVAWIAFTRPRYAIVSTLALIFALMITHAGVLTFVWLSSFGGPGVHLTVPEAVLLLIGRWGLVAVVLYSVGGVRYLPRMSPRQHDEGVELL